MDPMDPYGPIWVHGPIWAHGPGPMGPGEGARADRVKNSRLRAPSPGPMGPGPYGSIGSIWAYMFPYVQGYISHIYIF